MGPAATVGAATLFIMAGARAGRTPLLACARWIPIAAAAPSREVAPSIREAEAVRGEATPAPSIRIAPRATAATAMFTLPRLEAFTALTWMAGPAPEARAKRCIPDYARVI